MSPALDPRACYGSRLPSAEVLEALRTDPRERCKRCHGPMDTTLTRLGYGTHPCCDPRERPRRG